MKQRFITIEQYDGTITAHQQSEDYREKLDTAACWVWQYADDAEQAIAQHHDCYAAWEADIEVGRERETYGEPA